MSAADQLRGRSRDYELMARWFGERAESDVQARQAADASVVVAIVLREVAAALDSEADAGRRAA